MSQKDASLIFILGPTAVGKSEVAMELASKIGGEIVSADSMQVYRGMDIGTAKPTLLERRGIPHHLLDILDISQPYDVAQFRELAYTAITDIRHRGIQPIIVGGSGMYIRSLAQGLFEGTGKNEKIRSRLETLDKAELYQKLVEIDPLAAKKIHAHDKKRVVRAIEFFMETETPISASQTQWIQTNIKVNDPKNILIGLNRPRKELYRRCDTRVDAMFAKGFVEEVRELMNRGLEKSLTAGKANGYPEVIQLLNGKLTLEISVVLVKQRTRNFAKRQLTWFKKEPGIQWLDLSENGTTSIIAAKIQKMIERYTDFTC